MRTFIFIASIVCCLYFSALILYSYTDTTIQAVTILGEIITIPLLITNQAVLIVATLKWIAVDKLVFKSTYLFSFLLSVSSSLLLILAD
ncbi:hypothetical protein [Flavobacterium inviolabile]|uniref:hypothetical protein n=1 Tax=Flavobacterium inviolabile TaxID=2748320 RepID=UPI0015B3664A|nr:hypothetical protein [Flavobacterium inviolabile]